MARKKKRRLKRWVRITLWCILVAILGIVLWQMRAVFQIGHQENDLSEEMYSDAIHIENDRTFAPDTLVAPRIEKLLCSPQRLDTNDIAIAIYDLTKKKYIVQFHDKQLMPPASCLKLLTSTTAIVRLGLDHKYHHSMMIHGKVKGGTLYGDAILKCDDDPMIESLEPFVKALRDKGIKTIKGGLILDLMRRDTLRAHETAASWDIPYNKTPILLKGEPRIQRDLKYILSAAGIKVENDSSYMDKQLVSLSPKKDSVLWNKAIKNMEIKSRVVFSAETPINDVITPMLIHSSNIKADALYYHIQNSSDIRKTPTSADDYAPFLTRAEWQKHGLPTGFVINDGSGLSPDNRVDADFLMTILRFAWNEKKIRRYYIHEALATPGHAIRHGSLLGRMSAPMFRNRIFCKTGTIVTVGASSLAGFAHAPNDHWYAFVIINQNSPVAESRIFQDKVCKEIVRP